MAQARKAGNAIWPQHGRNTDSTQASTPSPTRSFLQHLHQSWPEGLTRFSLRKFKSTCAELQRGPSQAQLWGLTSSEAEKLLKRGMLHFVILTWTQEVQHRHIHALKCASKSRGTRGQRSPEQLPATSSCRAFPSCTPWSVLENPHTELWGCCWAGAQHWHLHLPHPTACSSQAPFFPQIYHDVCLYFNFNLILLLSHQPAWIIYKASFLWGSFLPVQWYFLSCCSCVTATFPAWPGHFSTPSPQTAVRSCWCFQYSWKRECSCVWENGGDQEETEGREG